MWQYGVTTSDSFSAPRRSSMSNLEQSHQPPLPDYSDESYQTAKTLREWLDVICGSGKTILEEEGAASFDIKNFINTELASYHC